MHNFATYAIAGALTIFGMLSSANGIIAPMQELPIDRSELRVDLPSDQHGILLPGLGLVDNREPLAESATLQSERLYRRNGGLVTRKIFAQVRAAAAAGLEGVDALGDDLNLWRVVRLDLISSNQARLVARPVSQARPQGAGASLHLYYSLGSESYKRQDELNQFVSSNTGAHPLGNAIATFIFTHLRPERLRNVSYLGRPRVPSLDRPWVYVTGYVTAERQTIPIAGGNSRTIEVPGSWIQTARLFPEGCLSFQVTEAWALAALQLSGEVPDSIRCPSPK